MTTPAIIAFDELGTGDVRTFRGFEHGGVPVSFILDRSQPGGGPALHRHPYDEVWILDEGEVTFLAGEETLTARSGIHRRRSRGNAAQVPQHRQHAGTHGLHPST